MDNNVVVTMFRIPNRLFPKMFVKFQALKNLEIVPEYLFNKMRYDFKVAKDPDIGEPAAFILPISEDTNDVKYKKEVAFVRKFIEREIGKDNMVVAYICEEEE